MQLFLTSELNFVHLKNSESTSCALEYITHIVKAYNNNKLEGLSSIVLTNQIYCSTKTYGLNATSTFREKHGALQFQNKQSQL